jgi:nucleoside-diphosphate-sugar epimerase
MDILVTGAAGFIGSHTCERLVAMGHTVLGIDNFSPYYDVSLKKQNSRSIEAAGVTFLEADLRYDDLATVFPATLDVVFHFAAHPGISKNSSFSDYFENNILATQRMMDVLETYENRPFVVNIATSSVYGMEATLTEDKAPLPVSWYGVTKLAAEQLVLAYARRDIIQGCSLRLYSVYGPRERPDKLYTKLIHCGLTNTPFTLFEGSEKHLRSYTYVQDIVDGVVSVLGKEHVCNTEIFNLGTAVENSTATGISIVEDLLGTAIAIARKPARPGDQSRTRANIDKAAKVLAYNPQTTLRAGLKAQIAWCKSML